MSLQILGVQAPANGRASTGLIPGGQEWSTWALSVRLSMVRDFSSVALSCPTLCDPMNGSVPGLPVHHQLLEFTQTHVHRVSDQGLQNLHLCTSAGSCKDSSQLSRVS